MAKTGGSSLNGMLANKFERVCGNKGNTYDYYSYNEGLKSMNVESIRLDQLRQKAIRERVIEFGFENCDYISLEVLWKDWVGNFANGTLHFWILTGRLFWSFFFHH